MTHDFGKPMLVLIFGGLDVTVGRFQRHFSLNSHIIRIHLWFSLDQLQRVTGWCGVVVDGVSLGGNVGDASFSFDIVGDDVFGDTVTYGGRVELGALGFGFHRRRTGRLDS